MKSLEQLRQETGLGPVIVKEENELDIAEFAIFLTKIHWRNGPMGLTKELVIPFYRNEELGTFTITKANDEYKTHIWNGGYTTECSNRDLISFCEWIVCKSNIWIDINDYLYALIDGNHDKEDKTFIGCYLYWLEEQKHKRQDTKKNNEDKEIEFLIKHYKVFDPAYKQQWIKSTDILSECNSSLTPQYIGRKANLLSKATKNRF